MDDDLLLEQLAPPGDWATQGTCWNHPTPDMWFPEKGDWVSSRDAKQICGSCPVVFECRSYALDTRQAYGIWGGLSAEDRRQLRRRGQAAA